MDGCSCPNSRSAFQGEFDSTASPGKTFLTINTNRPPHHRIALLTIGTDRGYYLGRFYPSSIVLNIHGFSTVIRLYIAHYATNPERGGLRWLQKIESMFNCRNT
jgi:hypothetical protein